MTLFTQTELADFLKKTVKAEAAASVERVVWGWLKPVLGGETRPDPVPAEVFSWAIELGAIAHENPAGRTARDLGPFKEQFSAERRAEILAEAARGGVPAAAKLAPRGCFPPAEDYPDPASW